MKGPGLKPLKTWALKIESQSFQFRPRGSALKDRAFNHLFNSDYVIYEFEYTITQMEENNICCRFGYLLNFVCHISEWKWVKFLETPPWSPAPGETLKMSNVSKLQSLHKSLLTLLCTLSEWIICLALLSIVLFLSVLQITILVMPDCFSSSIQYISVLFWSSS